MLGVRQEVHRKSPKFTFKLKCPIGKTLDHRSRGDTTWRAQTGKVESSHTLVTRQEMPVTLFPTLFIYLRTSHGLEQPCESLHPDIHLLFAREAEGGAHKRTG